MNSLNNFIYLTRLYKFYKQSIAKSCSLTDASNCYFTENNYIKNIPLSNIDSIINNDWIKIYSQMEDYDYEEFEQILINDYRSLSQRNKDILRAYLDALINTTKNQ